MQNETCKTNTWVTHCLELTTRRSRRSHPLTPSTRRPRSADPSGPHTGKLQCSPAHGCPLWKFNRNRRQTSSLLKAPYPPRGAGLITPPSKATRHCKWRGIDVDFRFIAVCKLKASTASCIMTPWWIVDKVERWRRVFADCDQSLWLIMSLSVT